MRTHPVRGRRRLPWGNLVAGFIALIALAAIALSPLLARHAISAFRHHEDSVAAATANHINQDVQDGDVDFTVHSTHCGDPSLEGVDGKKVISKYGSFCVVNVTVHNNGTNPDALAQEAQLATGSRGAVYPSDEVADTIVNGGDPAVVPGASWDDQLVYDVPAGIDLVGIDLHSTAYSRGVNVRLA